MRCARAGLSAVCGRIARSEVMHGSRMMVAVMTCGGSRVCCVFLRSHPAPLLRLASHALEPVQPLHPSSALVHAAAALCVTAMAASALSSAPASGKKRIAYYYVSGTSPRALGCGDI